VYHTRHQQVVAAHGLYSRCSVSAWLHCIALRCMHVAAPWFVYQPKPCRGATGAHFLRVCGLAQQSLKAAAAVAGRACNHGSGLRMDQAAAAVAYVVMCCTSVVNLSREL
jgi:hypothetical protein